MKWIKTAIGAVIAVMSIGIIATSVYKMTQSSEVIREVSFTIDYDEGKFLPISAYNDILEYSVFNEDNEVSNVIVYIDDEISDITVIFDEEYDILLLQGNLPDESGIIDSYIDAEGNWFYDGATFTYNITVNLVFEVIQPPQLTDISATLILLTPIIFVGGVLLYFYKPFKKE